MSSTFLQWHRSVQNRNSYFIHCSVFSVFCRSPRLYNLSCIVSSNVLCFLAQFRYVANFAASLTPRQFIIGVNKLNNKGTNILHFSFTTYYTVLLIGSPETHFSYRGATLSRKELVNTHCWPTDSHTLLKCNYRENPTRPDRVGRRSRLPMELPAAATFNEEASGSVSVHQGETRCTS